MVLDVTKMLSLLRQEIMSWQGEDEVFIDGVGVSPGAGEVSLLDVLNQSVSDAFLLAPWRMSYQNIATVASTQEYSIPLDWYTVLSVSISGVPLRKTNVRNLDKRECDWRNDSAGVPSVYYFNGTSKVGFHPKPNAIMQASFLHTKEPAELVLTTDTIADLPGAFHLIIVRRAAYLCAKRDTENEAAQKRADWLNGEYLEGIKRLSEFIAERMSNDEDEPVALSSLGMGDSA